MRRIVRIELVHYNQVLREQLAQLEAEVQSLVAPYAFMLDSPLRAVAVTPAMVERALRQDIAGITQALAQLRDDIAAFEDPDRLRQRLKDMARADRAVEAEENGTIDDFAAMLSSFDLAADPGPRRGRRRR